MKNIGYFIPFLLDRKTADKLDKKASHLQVSKNEIVSRYIELGIAAVDSGDCPRISPEIKGINSGEVGPDPQRVEESKNLLKFLDPN